MSDSNDEYKPFSGIAIDINVKEKTNLDNYFPPQMESLVLGKGERFWGNVKLPVLPNLKKLELKSVTREIDMDNFKNLEVLIISHDSGVITFKNSENHELKSLCIYSCRAVNCDFRNLKVLQFWDSNPRVPSRSIEILKTICQDFNDPYFSTLTNLKVLEIGYGFTNDKNYDFHEIFPNLEEITFLNSLYHEPYASSQPVITKLNLKNRMKKIITNLQFIDDKVESDYFDLGYIYDGIEPVVITRNITSSKGQITFKPKHYKFISIMKFDNGVIECDFEDSSLEVQTD